MKGSCNCGNVSFEVLGEPQGVSMCHCGQCRKQSGGIWSSAYVEGNDISIRSDVKWYSSSATAKRGFCPTCGAFMFWKHNDETTTSFALGAVDGPTGVKLEKHIFVTDKGDYYEIADGVPQREN